MKDTQQEDASIKLNRRIIQLSHTDKILFPKPPITKGDIIAYYHNVAPYMLPHIKNRAVSMMRHPDGIMHEGFFQKNIAEYYPAWIKSIAVKKEDGTHNQMAVCNNAATLVYLANQACITPHIWLSKIDKINHPDKLIFDLDPATDHDFDLVKKTALRLKEILESYNLVSFVMSTGSRGLHVIVPIKRTKPFDTVRCFAQHIASELVTLDPKHLTTETRKTKRGDKLFIDCGRNAYAQTSVAPYAIRALPHAPVATPLHWDELKKKSLSAQSFTIKNIMKRLQSVDDPWKDMYKSTRSLKM